METAGGALHAQPQVERRVFSLADAVGGHYGPSAVSEALERQNERLKAENAALRTKVEALELQLRQRQPPEQATEAPVVKCFDSGAKAQERAPQFSLQDENRPEDNEEVGVYDPEPANTESREATSSASAALSPRMSTVPKEVAAGFGDRTNKRQRITLQTARNSGGIESGMRTRAAFAAATKGPAGASTGGEKVARIAIYQSDESSVSDADSLLSEEAATTENQHTATKRSRPRAPVVTYGWKLPLDLTFAAFGDCWAQPPRLSIASFAQLDAARPWDLIFARRPKVSHVFNYQALEPSAKKWVRAILWFQFSFRHELWEFMHWVEMDERPEDGEWEAYRRFRAERVAKVLAAWEMLGSKVAKLVNDGRLPSDVWLDPCIWYFNPDEQLKWQYSSSNLVQQQAKEDLWHPARCYYVNDLRNHPFFNSHCEAKHPKEFALPPLLSPGNKSEVQVRSADGDNSDSAVMCPTSWGTMEYAPQFVVVPLQTGP